MSLVARNVDCQKFVVILSIARSLVIQKELRTTWLQIFFLLIFEIDFKSLCNCKFHVTQDRVTRGLTANTQICLYVQKNEKQIILFYNKHSGRARFLHKDQKIFCAKCPESIQTNSICSSFWLLADESRDFSQAEKKIIVSRAEQIHKMTVSFAQNGQTLLSQVNIVVILYICLVLASFIFFSHRVIRRM